jgi:hypothetical protein
MAKYTISCTDFDGPPSLIGLFETQEEADKAQEKAFNFYVREHTNLKPDDLWFEDASEVTKIHEEDFT